MKRLATLAACLLILSPTVQAEDEKIPQITTLAGETYKDVRIMKIQGDIVSIMHDAGIKKIKYSEMDEANGKLLGFEAYQNKNAEAAAAKKAKEDGERLIEKQKEDQKQATENQNKERIKKRREEEVSKLNTNPKKGATEWYFLYILQDDLKNAKDLKRLFGKPADFQSGDALCWRDVCWNPNTEKMDDIWVDSVEYTRLDGGLTIKEYVFRCGNEKIAVIDAPLHIKLCEAAWSKQKN